MFDMNSSPSSFSPSMRFGTIRIAIDACQELIGSPQSAKTEVINITIRPLEQRRKAMSQAGVYERRSLLVQAMWDARKMELGVHQVAEAPAQAVGRF